MFAIVVTPRPPAAGAEVVERRPWRSEAAEGFRWLWRHDVIRTLAISLGVLNLLGTMSTGLIVLFGQEVLDHVGDRVRPAVHGRGDRRRGGRLDGVSRVEAHSVPGASLALTLWGGAATAILTGFTSSWLIAALLTSITIYTAIMWNVITVSFRQSVIPDRLLGRVNSVYRFFGWGAIPIGGLLGGLIVAALDGPFSREVALRAPWIIAGVAQLVLAAVVGRKLTTARLEAARAGQRRGERPCGRTCSPVTWDSAHQGPDPGARHPGSSCVRTSLTRRGE